ncbi:MAG: ABC transporter ATP-binding protein [Peptococcaceae bacterium]|nr:ABC transporter ATP-binding protein [Peptococcaceae bacterium]
MAVLEVEKAVVGYGGVIALDGASLAVESGEVVAVIGPNGSGKTTFLRAVSGLVKLQSGTIRLDGRDVTGLPAHRRVRLGLVCAPERARVAREMTVLDNLKVGAYLRRDRDGIMKTLNEVFDLFPCLAQKKHALAGALSGGEKQMLVIGRALLAGPRVLLLDEPFFGLSVGMKQIFAERIKKIQNNGVAIVLTEHDLNSVLKVAGRIYGFCNGRVVFAGSAGQFVRDNLAQKIYA